MIDLLVAAGIFLAALGLGRLGTWFVGVKADTRLEKTIFETALGWAGLSMILLALGLLGRLQPPLVWGVVLSLALLGLWFQGKSFWTGGWSRRVLPTPSRLEALVLLSAGALLLLTLVLALAPTNGYGPGSWDGLSYHLTIPKLFVEQGRIVPVPFMVYSTYPLGMHMLFIPGLMLGLTAAAQLLHFGMAILVALAMAALAARYATPAVALLSPAVFLAIPLVRNEAAWPSNDLGVVLYTFLALLAIIRWSETGQRPWLVTAGILAGFACSIKLTAAFGVAASGLVFLWLVGAQRPRRVTDWMIPCLTLAVPLLLFGAPWYVRNYMMVGNPFMPYLYDLLGGANWSAEAAERLQLHLASFGLSRNQIPIFVFLAASAGCWLLAGFLALRARFQPVVKALLMYTLLYLALWLVGGSTQQRFLLPIYPVLALIVVWFVASHVRRSAILRPVLYSVVALALIASSSTKVSLAGDSLPVVIGQERREDFLSRQLYNYQAYQFINTQLPRSARLFIFPENRTFYLNRPYIWGDPYSQDMIDYARYESSSDLLEELTKLGITHIVVHRSAYSYWQQMAGDEPRLRAYLERAVRLVEGLDSLKLRQVFFANDVTIYALPDTLLDH